MSAPFKRQDEPFVIDVKATATKFDMPAGYFKEGGKGQNATSFWVTNPNSFWVRLKGSGDGLGETGAYVPAADGANGVANGWLLPPGFFGALSSQLPRYLSTIAVTRMGAPAGTGTIEITYGGGM